MDAPLFESSRLPQTASTVLYGTDGFAEAAQKMATRHDAGRGPVVVLQGGTREQRQQALATLTRYATGNVHQFRMPALLNERRVQTQNNLRKAFDHAAEEDALLYFDAADALFEHTPSEPMKGEGEAEPTVLEYVFDRVAAHPGLVLLGLRTTEHVDASMERGAHLVVRFT
jgi:hypothetical protein